MGRHHFIEEIALADCVVDVEESGLTALLETAALALVEAMVDPATVEPTWMMVLEAAEFDLFV